MTPSREPFKPTRILIVRHGETDWNRTRRAQGQIDIPLNEEGRAQARRVSGELADRRLAAVYSSDLARAADTARVIANAHRLEVVLDPAFREMDQGEWEGLSNEEIKRRWPVQWNDRWRSARPGGESPEEVLERMLNGIGGIADRHPGDVVALVGHGAAIRWVVAVALGYGRDRMAEVRGMGNGGVVAIDVWRDEGELRFDNVERGDGEAPGVEDPNA